MRTTWGLLAIVITTACSTASEHIDAAPPQHDAPRVIDTVLPDTTCPQDGVYNTDTQCGGCNIDCTSLALANATGTCNTASAPTCQATCSTGYYDLDGLLADGCEFQIDTSGIYVSNADTNAVDDAGCGLGPTGSGTGNYPCKTITQALSRAVAAARSEVIVADGTYDEAVTLVDGIALLGGYHGDTWQRHLATTDTVIQGVATTGVHDRTVIANAIMTPTVFEGFIVRGSDNAQVGGNSYAVYITGSSANLTIRNNQIFAGRGGPGMRGGAGDNGSPGTNGTAYSAALDSITATGSGQCNAAANRAASGGASKTCGATSVGGGNGGGNNCSPSRSTQNSTATSPAVAGNAGGGAGGGTAGAAGVRGYDAELDANTCYVPVSGATQLPQAGADGKDGGNGAAGSGVAGCTAAAGSIAGGDWVGTAAPTGVIGSNGGGGGGGAAGGGAHCDLGQGTCTADMFGGHGGGGATAGCGGTGGGGGGTGGGAFGIFIIGSAQPVVTGNAIQIGVGGTGGEGGIGGAGGLGGIGGGGGQTGTLFCTGKGGRGGDGGNGGAGSGGGGGCGGISVGIYSSGLGTPNYCSAANNVFTGGEAAIAGSGGFSGGSSGGTGTAGLFETCSLN